jgi:hypothetical protein
MMKWQGRKLPESMDRERIGKERITKERIRTNV